MDSSTAQSIIEKCVDDRTVKLRRSFGNSQVINQFCPIDGTRMEVMCNGDCTDPDPVYQALWFVEEGEDGSVTHEIREQIDYTFKIDGDTFTQDAGHLCEVNHDCDDNLLCKDNSNGAKTCQVESGAGGDCGTSSFGCQAGLLCDPATSSCLSANDVCGAGCTNSTTTVQTCADAEIGCIKSFAPVCGNDGVTYGNSCYAGCNGRETWEYADCPALY